MIRKPDDDIHIVPENDLREHEIDKRCWCKPTVDDTGDSMVVVHNSLDGRELTEPGAKLPQGGN